MKKIITIALLTLISCSSFAGYYGIGQATGFDHGLDTGAQINSIKAIKEQRKLEQLQEQQIQMQIQEEQDKHEQFEIEKQERQQKLEAAHAKTSAVKSKKDIKNE